MEEQEFEELKVKLKKIKSQKKRRKLLDEYNDKFTNEDLLKRFNALKEKSKQKMFVPKAICIWGSIMYLPSWIITIFVGFPALAASEKDGNSFIEWIGMLVAFVASFWDLAGPLIVIVLLIITMVKRKKPEYYLNIDNI